jgi:hypothetical protein
LDRIVKLMKRAGYASPAISPGEGPRSVTLSFKAPVGKYNLANWKPTAAEREEVARLRGIMADAGIVLYKNQLGVRHERSGKGPNVKARVAVLNLHLEKPFSPVLAFDSSGTLNVKHAESGKPPKISDFPLSPSHIRRKR